MADRCPYGHRQLWLGTTWEECKRCKREPPPELVPASTVDIGHNVLGAYTNRVGEVIDIQPSGFRVKFEGDEPASVYHPHLHLKAMNGSQFTGPWWPRAREQA